MKEFTKFQWRTFLRNPRVLYHYLRIRLTDRYCKQCQQRGHKKWLWLGTHRTHRLYLRFKIWCVGRRK